MKEIQPLSLLPNQRFVNYGYDYEEPLLEYVALLAEEYKPCHPEDIECGFFVSTAIDTFAYRYLGGKVEKRSMLKYLENTEVLQTIKALGYDENQFWYLLMFILDYSTGICIEGIKPNEAPKKQISKVTDAILSNVGSIQEYTNEPVFHETAKITLKIGKKNITIDNKIALVWLAVTLNEELDKVDYNSPLNISSTPIKVTNGKIETVSLKEAVHICYFAKMFIKFFELNPPAKVSRKKNSPSYNKLLLISRLIYLTKVSINEKFDSSEDTLKGYFKQYKNFKIDMINGRYL